VLRVHVRKMRIRNRRRICIPICHRCKRSDNKPIAAEGSGSAASAEGSRPVTAFATVRNMGPGSLVESWRRCRTVGFWCAKPGNSGHGLSWSLTYAVSGKTETKVMPQDAVEETKDQIATSRRFRYREHALVGRRRSTKDPRLGLPGLKRLCTLAAVFWFHAMRHDICGTKAIFPRDSRHHS
jgi:hypothetical protein